MRSFNVIVERGNKFIPYDVIPYLVDKYKETKKSRYTVTPKTFDEFKEFIKGEAQYHWWGRCEYEIILLSWPPKETDKGFKIDVYWQLMKNIDIVTEILMNEVKQSRRKVREE